MASPDDRPTADDPQVLHSGLRSPLFGPGLPKKHALKLDFRDVFSWGGSGRPIIGVGARKMFYHILFKAAIGTMHSLSETEPAT